MSDGARVKRILFVCMGNICRSPLAEGLLVHKVRARGVADRYVVDSAGTGDWHVGQLADPRMRAVAEANGVTLESRARQVTTDDFSAFDHIICMDEDNREHLLAMGAPPQRLRLLLEFDPGQRLVEVPDPYQGDEDGFRTVYRLVDSACERLLDALEEPS